MDLIGVIAIALLLLLGRVRIQQHAMTEGAFIAFIIAVFKLYDPMRKFALFYNNFPAGSRRFIFHLQLHGCAG